MMLDTSSNIDNDDDNQILSPTTSASSLLFHLIIICADERHLVEKWQICAYVLRDHMVISDDFDLTSLPSLASQGQKKTR